ncbi:hypothetical protein HDU83_006681 [Entophlyctis luteolus]|nr:hypothetical protein HDU82_006496 [Entophlyctis luteolus]KAJ3341325.1 hypothetical protein HDU83_006681 [Entophlyctis luteolus]
MVAKNKSGAQKKREQRARQQLQKDLAQAHAQAEQQQQQPALTPAQAAALVIRQQQAQERLAKIESGVFQQEQASLAISAIGKTRRAPLLDADDALLPNVRTALLEIFARFDDDNDGALNRLELERFAIATNGEKFEESAIDELKKSFNCDAEGNLTRTGFLEMYQLQTLSEPNETWRDLIKHGYSVNVQLIRRATGSYDPSYVNQTPAPTTAAEASA